MSLKKTALLVIASLLLGMLSMYWIAGAVLNKSLLDLTKEMAECTTNTGDKRACETAVTVQRERYKMDLLRERYRNR